ncbi:MAG: acetyl-CoA carboxylase biotin carboxylase subunit, partial [Lachnospiraceae bacterium]|nr:acetyl-CoA carboxylase biotin carboxylase subunit [Lachnospiraceae bacterium]
RLEAISKIKRALYEFIIDGIHTNIEFQNSILNNPDYQKGNFNTSFLESFLEEWKE